MSVALPNHLSFSLGLSHSSMVPFHLHALIQAKTRATRISIHRTRVESVGTALASRSQLYTLRARGATRATAPRASMVVHFNDRFPHRIFRPRMRLLPPFVLLLRPRMRLLPLFVVLLFPRMQPLPPFVLLLRHHLRRHPESPLTFHRCSRHHLLACSLPTVFRQHIHHRLLACSPPLTCHHRALAR